MSGHATSHFYVLPSEDEWYIRMVFLMLPALKPYNIGCIDMDFSSQKYKHGLLRVGWEAVSRGITTGNDRVIWIVEKPVLIRGDFHPRNISMVNIACCARYILSWALLRFSSGSIYYHGHFTGSQISGVYIRMVPGAPVIKGNLLFSHLWCIDYHEIRRIQAKFVFEVPFCDIYQVKLIWSYQRLMSGGPGG